MVSIALFVSFVIQMIIFYQTFKKTKIMTIIIIFFYQVFMFFFYEHLENNLEKSLEGFGGAGTATTPSKT